MKPLALAGRGRTCHHAHVEKEFAMPSARHGRFASALIIALPIALLTGCSPWATYPPVESKTAQALTKPTFEPVPTVMAVAIDYARDNYTPGKELPINLPDGADWEVYDKVFTKLAHGGTPMTKRGEPALCIQEVRTRAFEAQVDVVYPRADGLNQLVTLSLEREVFKDWRVKSARPWQIRNVEMPDPHYVGPTAEELVKKHKDEGPAGERVTLETNAQSSK
jgi:hypothetical protein